MYTGTCTALTIGQEATSSGSRAKFLYIHATPRYACINSYPMGGKPYRTNWLMFSTISQDNPGKQCIRTGKLIDIVAMLNAKTCAIVNWKHDLEMCNDALS